MKTVDIIGKNYLGNWERTRKACRGIIQKDGKILLIYEKANDLWIIPGGGMEAGEDEVTCCKRELSEETGLITELSECLAEVTEYYENWRFISYYFLAVPVGEGERNLTDREEMIDMESRWISIEEAIGIFSRHAEYAEISEVKRGIYLREYTALCAIFS